MSPSPPRKSYGLPLTEAAGLPHEDASGVTEGHIRHVVEEFYRRARLDPTLGPVFADRVRDWDKHLATMTDFWSAALLRSGRYSGNPIRQHRAVGGLTPEHFDRWIALFQAAVSEVCPEAQARAFLVRALRMREAMVKALSLAP